jgi:hypothetical protein
MPTPRVNQANIDNPVNKAFPNLPSDGGIFESGATLLTQDFYQYSIYKEYIKNLNYYLLNSKKDSVVVKFYHNYIPKNSNFDNETSIHNVKKLEDSVYNVYEFCPSFNNNPLSYQIGRNDDRFGYDINSSSTMTIFQMTEPLPDDLFSFYSEPNEIFRVLGVTYIQSVHKDLKLYQITYENAPLVKSSLDLVQVNETYYFNNEFDIWYPSHYYSNFVGLINQKANLIKTIKSFYNPTKCLFSDISLSADDQTLVNRTIHALKTLAKVDLPVILNYKYQTNDNGYPIVAVVPAVTSGTTQTASALYVAVATLYELYSPFINITLDLV